MSPRSVSILLLVLAATASGCKRGEATATQGTAPAASTSEGAAAPASEAHAAPAADRRFEGTYDAQPGSMYIPRDGDVPNAAEWAGTKFRSDDAGVGRGTGSLTLVVSAGGTVSGEGSGALGPFTVTGQRLGDRLVATLRGSGPEAFVGTLDLHERGGTVTGEGRASDGEARIVRTFTVTLTAK